jgi:hypothetical protein
MRKDFDVKNLDKDTLEFAIEKAWQFEFLCKKTKEGRALASAYNQVQKTLQHYVQQVEESK